MDTINPYSLSIVDLNTKFQDRCHAEWSKTNLISIISLDGVYILKPQLENQNGPFHVELIRNPTTKFKHQALNDYAFVKFDQIWQTLNSSQYMEVFMDPALTTNIDSLSLDSYPRRYRLTKWSPVIQCYPRQCLLATITVDYQLLIFNRIDNTWAVKADLSKEFDKLWVQLYASQEDLNTKDNYEIIRKHLHSLSFCNICWKETKYSGPILLAATIPGEIVVWQVPLIDSATIGDPEVQVVLKTNLEFITAMDLFQNLLIVSARDGQVVLYDLTYNFNAIETVSRQRQANGVVALKVVTLAPTAPLWHKDNIEVADFYIQPISKDTFRIVLAKSTNICWCMINYIKKADDDTATLSISDSFSAIDGLDPDVLFYQSPATWLKPAGDKRAVIIADDGAFFQLEFLDTRQDASPEFNSIRTGKVDLTRMVPRGLCTSPNGHLITMISSISLIYETRKILAPTKVLVLPTINDNRFLVECFGKLLNDHWLETEHIESPMDVFDSVDYIRSLLPNSTSTQLNEIYKILTNAILDIKMPKNDTQLVKLKICAFLLKKLLSQQHCNVKMIEAHNSTGSNSKIHDVILLYNIKNILASTMQRLMRESGDENICTFNEDQVNSMRNYFVWLNQSPDRTHVSQQYTEQFKIFESKYQTTPAEICPICKIEVPFVNYKCGTCINGHRFDRCARSLLLINLSTGNEIICEHCDRHYTTRLVWPTNNFWLCSFCQ